MKKAFKKNKFILLTILISIITLIVGSFAIGMIKSAIIVAMIDVILFLVPSFMKKNKNASPKQKKKLRKKILKVILVIILSLIILGIVAVTAFMIYIVKSAPDFDPANLLQKDSTILYDKDGEIIAKLGTQKREKVSYDELPQVLIDAIIATEDSRFFQHNGFDAARFFKASFFQILSGGGGGASTITMQISKNAYTSTTSSGFEGLKRKFTDIYLSIFKIEKKYSKEEILEFYVNSYYMGAGAYGVQQASLTYFNKPVSQINVAEAAMLAGMFQSPGAYDPYINPKSTESRRQNVLYLMERHGYITSEEREIASKITVEDMLKGTTSTSSNYQGFIDTVVEEVKERTGSNPYTTPMLIYTTMDRKKQNAMNSIFTGETYKWENDVIQSGVTMIESKTGSIVAIGAGRNRKGQSTFNYATMINRQIGSTSKPLYDYGPGIEFNNWSTYQLFADEPHAYTGGTKVSNNDGRYGGLMTMREALKQSRNIPAIKAFQANDKQNIISFTQSLGLHPDTKNGLYEPHAIGGYNGESPLSMASAYAAFSNGGYYIEPHSFTKVVYRDTEEIYEVKVAPSKVMSEATAYMIDSMLVTTATYLTGTSTVNGVTYGMKTGTTDYDAATKKLYNFKPGSANDLWVAGVTPDYSIALWLGYDRINSQYTNRSGSGQNTRLFKAIIKATVDGTKSFTKPDSVVSVTVEKETNPAQLPSQYTPDNMKITELFKKGTEPTEVSNRYSKLSNVTNLTVKVTDSNVILSWNPISTPDAISDSAITELANSLFEDEKYNSNFINSRKNYNASNIGTITYNIYIKNDDGTLSYLTTTNGNSISINKPSSSTTYVVKTSYTIFKSNMSDGVSTKVNIKEEQIIQDNIEQNSSSEDNPRS